MNLKSKKQQTKPKETENPEPKNKKCLLCACPQRNHYQIQNSKENNQNCDMILKGLEPLSPTEKKTSNTNKNRASFEKNQNDIFKINIHRTPTRKISDEEKQSRNENQFEKFKSPKKSKFFLQSSQKNEKLEVGGITPNNQQDNFYLDKKNLYTRQEIKQLNKLKQLIRLKRKDPSLQIEINGEKMKEKFLKNPLASFTESENSRRRREIRENNGGGFWSKVFGIFGCE